MNFAESLDRAIDLVALFDKDKNAKLDKAEFKEAIDSLLESMDSNFHEFSEFLIFQMVFLPGNDIAEEIVSDIAAPEIEEEVKQRGEYYGNLMDPRMIALFQLFDLDGDGSVSFVEVVMGLYTLTGDMKNSEKLAVDCLLLFDEDGNRTLDYGEFAKLVSRIAVNRASV
jgi:Ca2+-binding EF-hand superfamily protein